MNLTNFKENNLYIFLLFFLVLASAVMVLGIMTIRKYCCTYCKLTKNGKRLAQLETNRCESFIDEQLRNAHHQPLRLV